MFTTYASPLSKRNTDNASSSIDISIVYKEGRDDLYSRCPTKMVDNYKYCILPHESYYGIKIRNNNFTTYNAVLNIDGVDMGKFRIESRGTHTIYRPAHSKRSFVFVEDDSDIAGSSGVTVGDKNNGLVEITFIPVVKHSTICIDEELCIDEDLYIGGRYKPRYFNEHCPTNNTDSFGFGSYSDADTSNMLGTNNNHEYEISMSYKSGATVLGDDNKQRFRNATEYKENTNDKFTKRIRLVASSVRREKYVSINTKDINIADDPIPPPIGSYNYL
jgi:hypothetical protein